MQKNVCIAYRHQSESIQVQDTYAVEDHTYGIPKKKKKIPDNK